MFPKNQPTSASGIFKDCCPLAKRRERLIVSMTHDIIIKQHGGRIDVETEPGIFFEFVSTLPRGVEASTG